MPGFSIANASRSKGPSFSLVEKIKNFALGKDFSVSLVLVGERKIRSLNKKFRQKDKPTNVLSFSLGKNIGEIFLCPAKIRKEAPLFGKKPNILILDMFIHALCHLKGMDHGSRMESEENKIRRRFKI